MPSTSPAALGQGGRGNDNSRRLRLATYCGGLEVSLKAEVIGRNGDRPVGAGHFTLISSLFTLSANFFLIRFFSNMFFIKLFVFYG